MRRAQMSPVMYLVLGMILLIALLVLIFALRDKGFGLVDRMGAMFG